MSSGNKSSIVILFLTTLPALCGCGDGSNFKVAPVTGLVMLDGEPLPNAIVAFRPESGRSSSGVTNDLGEFELTYSAEKTGAIVGSHTVCISRGTSGQVQGMMSNPDTEPKAEAAPTLPTVYNTQTNLTAEVVDEENFVIFRLDSNPQ